MSATKPTAPSVPGLTRLAGRLNDPGAEALARLPDDEILDAWNGAVDAFLDPTSPERRAIDDDLVRTTRLSSEGLEAGLQAVLGGVRGDAAERTFERAARMRDAEGDQRTARRLAWVVLASNLPALAVQPLLPALAVRRPVLLKSPSAEPVFTPAFVRALVERLPALGDAVAAEVWSGGNEERERVLLERAGVVLAYGDAESTASLERRAAEVERPPRVVAYGPKTSLAGVGRGADLEAAARGLARDVALFDQRGCLSIAAVYVEGDAQRAGALAEALAAELATLAKSWPPGPAAAEDAAAFRQLRAVAEMRGLPLRPVSDRLSEGTVLVDADPVLQPTPGLRTVRVHPVANLEALPTILEPWTGQLQGVAVAGVDTETAGTLVPALQALGVSRITAPGELQHPDTSWHNGGADPLGVLGSRRRTGEALRTVPHPDPSRSSG